MGRRQSFIRMQGSYGEPRLLPAASLAGVMELFLPSLLENRSNSSKPNGEIPREFCFLFGLPRDGRVLPHAPTLPLLGSPVTLPRCPCGVLTAKESDPVPPFPHPDPTGRAGKCGASWKLGKHGGKGAERGRGGAGSPLGHRLSPCSRGWRRPQGAR